MPCRGLIQALQKRQHALAMSRRFVEALMKDAEWLAKLEKAQTMAEVERVLSGFGKVKGFKVMEV